MKRALLFLFFLTGILFGAAPSRAHGGEDHGEKLAPSAIPADGISSLEAATDSLEAVLKHGPIRPGEKTELKLFLSDAEDNAPVAGAKAELEIGDIEGFKLEFHPEPAQPGIYHADAIFPREGHFDAVVSVSSARSNDLIVIRNISVGDASGTNGSGAASLIFTFAALVAALAFVFIVSRKILVSRRRVDAKIVTVLALYGLVHAPAAMSHGGEDHGGEGHASTARQLGSVVTMAKDSQFLLGVRTRIAREEETVAAVNVLGKISHRATGQQDVFATTDGRLVAPASGRIALVGQEMKKGESLGFLASIGVIALEAPFDGIVAYSEFHPGQWVTAGTKLFTIVDPSVVWIEANVFQKDLPRINEDSKVTVIAENVSGAVPKDFGAAAYPGTVLNVGRTFDEDTRTALVTIEVRNPERKLTIGQWAKVYIETPQSLRAIAIPKSALLKKQGLPVVFVKIAAERFEGRVAQVAGERGDQVYLLSGVADGEKVVTGGNYQLLPFLGNIEAGK